jgi:hypothetical protein
LSAVANITAASDGKTVAGVNRAEALTPALFPQQKDGVGTPIPAEGMVVAWHPPKVAIDRQTYAVAGDPSPD